MSPHTQRAQVLIQQARYEDASKEARKALTSDPEDVGAMMILALSLSEMKQFKEAESVAKEAVGLAPEYPHCHYVLAHVYNDKDDLKKARVSVDEAINLDPENEDYYGLLASILLQQNKKKEALEAAGEGLKINPEDVTCANMRAMALTQMGRSKDAALTIDSALENDPDDSHSHANKGWALLHQGIHKEAAVHFKEALRLNPDNEWARQGIVESLRARHFLYRMMLSYYLWMSRLGSKWQFAFVIGLIVGVRIVRRLGENYPQFQPYAIGIIVAYFCFFYFSWAAPSFFNLFLRLHPLGKHALKPMERLASDLVGLCLVITVLSIIGFFIFPGPRALVSALVFFVLVIPISAALGRPNNKRRGLLVGYTVFLVAVGLGSIAFAGTAAGMPFLGLFAVGVMIFTWMGFIATTSG